MTSQSGFSIAHTSKASLCKMACLAGFLSVLGASTVYAGGFTAANIQYLYGQDNGEFGLEGGDAFSLWTFELANAWTYGDNFFFTDWTNGPAYDKKNHWVLMANYIAAYRLVRSAAIR